MIIVHVFGGLGNQMFQYATGRRLAYIHRTELYIDTPGSVVYPVRKYELDIFRIHTSIASAAVRNQVAFSAKDFFRLKIQKVLHKEKKLVRYVKERTCDFEKRVLSLPDNIYLDGYWQSEKYFFDISETIRKEFSFIHPPSQINQAIMKKIKECNSVGVHIRRGDYANNPEIRKIHLVCDEAYYKNAITWIMTRIDNPSFFIFSDDPLWAQENVVPDAPVTYLSHNTGVKDYEDLRLMIHCKHHIISNSSFSWWGAWLGKKESQVVVVPNRWYNTKSCNYSDRIPSNWIITD
jgi:hypothetical protein